MSFDKILDLTAGVYFQFYNIWDLVQRSPLSMVSWSNFDRVHRNVSHPFTIGGPIL